MNATLLSLLCLVCAPEPQFIPVPQFIPIPKFEATIRDSRIVAPCPGGVCPVEVAPTKRTERTWGITGYTQRCTSCPMVPQYGWVEKEVEVESIHEAAQKLQGWRDLAPEETKRLSDIVDAPARAKAVKQEWSLATCQMLCVQHGSVLYDVHEDGAREPATIQPSEAPDEGVSAGSGFRLFRRRR